MKVVVVTGAGHLGSTVAQALATQHCAPLRLFILSHDADRARWAADAANAQASLRSTVFKALPLALSCYDESVLASALKELRPALVINTASMQSPWTLQTSGDLWSTIVRQAGFGVTAPLQAVIAYRVARATATLRPKPVFINACYPDVVNGMIAGAGVPVACGIGNSGILHTLLMASACQAFSPLRLIAHHGHLGSIIRGLPVGFESARAWNGEIEATEELRSWMATARIPSDQRLNNVTAGHAAKCILGLVGHCAPFHTSLPGPADLPGGYPVWLEEGCVSLDLPKSFSLDDAVRLNRQSDYLDGILDSSNGTVRFTADSIEKIRILAPQARRLMEPFTVHDLEPLLEEIKAMRVVSSGHG